MKNYTDIKTKQKDVSIDSLYQKDAQTAYNICKACEGYDTCTFPMNLSSPILHCAEFKPFESVTKVKATIKTVIPGLETVEYVGLCRNCDHRDECVNCKPDKHVLNCGEYQ